MHLEFLHFFLHLHLHVGRPNGLFKLSDIDVQIDVSDFLWLVYVLRYLCRPVVLKCTFFWLFISGHHTAILYYDYVHYKYNIIRTSLNFTNAIADLFSIRLTTTAATATISRFRPYCITTSTPVFSGPHKRTYAPHTDPKIILQLCRSAPNQRIPRIGTRYVDHLHHTAPTVVLARAPVCVCTHVKNDRNPIGHPLGPSPFGQF